MPKFFAFLADPLYLLLLSFGFMAWLLPRPGFEIGLLWLALKAVAEEVAFRYGLQEFLTRRFAASWPSSRADGPLPGITIANLVTSAVFAAFHLISQPPLAAASVFVPSLAFGLAWDRHKNLLACWLLHFAYNALLFYRV
jgi:hypothetical protein